jgi:hypothetical protein
MDKTDDPIKPWSMRSRTSPSPWAEGRCFEPFSGRFLPVLFLALAEPLGCSTAPPRQVGDSPFQVDTAPSAEPSGNEAKPEEEPKQNVLSSGVKGSEGKDNSIPDDYTLTERDCDTLGKQYGAVARSDQLAALNPKLSDKQRAVAEANIDKGVGVIESQWIDSCIKSLAGKVADRSALKCAMGAKTVSAFQVCLGDTGPSGKGGKK